MAAVMPPKTRSGTRFACGDIMYMSRTSSSESAVLSSTPSCCRTQFTLRPLRSSASRTRCRAAAWRSDSSSFSKTSKSAQLSQRVSWEPATRSRVIGPNDCWSCLTRNRPTASTLALALALASSPRGPSSSGNAVRTASTSSECSATVRSHAPAAFSAARLASTSRHRGSSFSTVMPRYRRRTSSVPWRTSASARSTFRGATSSRSIAARTSNVANASSHSGPTSAQYAEHSAASAASCVSSVVDASCASSVV
mmetsp:Transcript_3410/g.13187  ORF Transcript_3410/g.13187 Transcript_3410/m.13187 type:complete len:253 (+) Transcript_3410:468-1226(+)